MPLPVVVVVVVTNHDGCVAFITQLLLDAIVLDAEECFVSLHWSLANKLINSVED